MVVVDVTVVGLVVRRCPVDARHRRLISARSVRGANRWILHRTSRYRRAKRARRVYVRLEGGVRGCVKKESRVNAVHRLMS
jgi:hypothetical protein